MELLKGFIHEQIIKFREDKDALLPTFTDSLEYLIYLAQERKALGVSIDTVVREGGTGTSGNFVGSISWSPSVYTIYNTYHAPAGQWATYVEEGKGIRTKDKKADSLRAFATSIEARHSLHMHYPEISVLVYKEGHIVEEYSQEEKQLLENIETLGVAPYSLKNIAEKVYCSVPDISPFRNPFRGLEIFDSREYLWYRWKEQTKRK